MIAIYLGTSFMVFGCFGFTLCQLCDYTGFVYYLSIGFMPLGMTLLGYGAEFVDRKIKTMEETIKNLNLKTDSIVLQLHKRNTHREDI